MQLKSGSLFIRAFFIDCSISAECLARTLLRGESIVDMKFLPSRYSIRIESKGTCLLSYLYRILFTIIKENALIF
jgi:hypothetical protein